MRCQALFLSVRHSPPPPPLAPLLILLAFPSPPSLPAFSPPGRRFLSLSASSPPSSYLSLSLFLSTRVSVSLRELSLSVGRWFLFLRVLIRVGGRSPPPQSLSAGSLPLPRRYAVISAADLLAALVTREKTAKTRRPATARPGSTRNLGKSHRSSRLILPLSPPLPLFLMHDPTGVVIPASNFAISSFCSPVVLSFFFFCSTMLFFSDGRRNQRRVDLNLDYVNMLLGYRVLIKDWKLKIGECLFLYTDSNIIGRKYVIIV